MGDLRQAFRALGREPGFTAVAVATLALGIGANAAIFAVVDYALLRPLPFREPSRLVAVLGVERATGQSRSISYPDFRDFQQMATSAFEGFAAYRGLTLSLTGSGEPARIDAAAASGDLFGLLGVRPLLGRTFTPEEDRPGGAPAVILSEELWRGRFGGRRAVLGGGLTLDGQRHTVVGVLPASFRFPREARLWVAAGPQPRNEYRGVHAYRVLARLRDGAGIDPAAAELRAVTARLAAAYPEDDAGRSARVEPLRDAVVGRARPGLVLLLGAVLLVLLITCANLAGLQVARGARRARELAVRVSLGVTRGRLVRQLLAETAVLATLGAAAGLALAAWLVPVLVALAPADLPRLAEVRFDARVALVALAAAVATAAAFGIAPAWLATRLDPAAVLHAESGRLSPSRTRQRLRQGLTLAQTALAVVLLTGAGLLVRSLWALGQVRPGFEASGLLVADVQLPEARYRGFPAWTRFYQELLPRLRGLPGVESAAIASDQPFSPGWGARFGIEGRPPFPQGDEPEPAVRVVTPGYLLAAGIALRRGRDLDEHDRIGAPGAVLINEAMAARFFPGEDPLGHRLLREWFAPEMPTAWEIVGIVADVRTGALESPPQDAIYYPMAQVAFPGATLLVRSRLEPGALAASVRTAVRGLDPELPLGRVQPMEEVVAESLGPRRFQASLLALFAALALLLAAIGLYGVLAYAVVQRRREIAVRVALGALRRDVVRLVAGQALALGAAGLGLGVAGALALARALGGLLFEVRPLDVATLAVVAASLAVTTLLASLVPLRRALGVQPAAVLRSE